MPESRMFCLVLKNALTNQQNVKCAKYVELWNAKPNDYQLNQPISQILIVRNFCSFLDWSKTLETDQIENYFTKDGRQQNVVWNGK